MPNVIKGIPLDGEKLVEEEVGEGTEKEVLQRVREGTKLLVI